MRTKQNEATEQNIPELSDDHRRYNTCVRRVTGEETEKGTQKIISSK
jgi:hypothetical protein